MSGILFFNFASCEPLIRRLIHRCSQGNIFMDFVIFLRKILRLKSQSVCQCQNSNVNAYPNSPFPNMTHLSTHTFLTHVLHNKKLTRRSD